MYYLRGLRVPIGCMLEGFKAVEVQVVKERLKSIEQGQYDYLAHCSNHGSY